jgi:hypothetical protein
MKLHSRALACVALLLACGAGLQAARGIPAPLLIQLSNGWTVIAAEVVESRRKPGAEPNEDAPYTTVLRVVRVLAAPKDVGRDLVPGARITLDLSYGYAATVEDYGGIDPQTGTPDALKSGEKFYMSVKPIGAGRCQHAGGAGAAKWVRQFDPEYEGLVSKVEALARLPEDARYRRCVEIVADAETPDCFRQAALSGIYYWGTRYPTPDAERAAHTRARTDLLTIWNNPNARMSSDLLLAIDSRLKTVARQDPTWLEGRERVWLEWFLSPLPTTAAERESTLTKRWNTLSLFREMLLDRPESFAGRLMSTIERQDIHVRLRAALFFALAHGFQLSEFENRSWEVFLQKELPELIEDGDVMTLRALSYFGRQAQEPADHISKRRFIPNEDVARAMERARARLQENPELPQSDTAIIELSNAIETIRRVDGGEKKDD